MFTIFSILAFLFCFHPAAYGNDDDHESRGRHVVRVLRRREKLKELTEEAEKERGTEGAKRDLTKSQFIREEHHGHGMTYNSKYAHL